MVKAGDKDTQPNLSIQRERKAKRIMYLSVALVIAAVLIFIGVFYYLTYVAPFRRVIITVDDIQLRMDYFLERAKLAQASPAVMIQTLTNEILVKKGAAQDGIIVTTQDIDLQLRRSAAPGGQSLSESEFREWYRQQLNKTQVSDALYREVIANSILQARLHVYLAENIKTVVPQVHVNFISVNTQDEAQKVIDRWNAGEDFVKLARELSTDSDSRDKGGDLGWMPFEAAIYSQAAFGLEVGKISQPYPYVADASPNSNSDPAFYYVLLVTEKSDARPVDDQYLPALKNGALDKWLTLETVRHQIHWNFNSEIYAWLSNQLGKNSPASNNQ